jgi:uncharacterized repeat protein (TIGR03803 family)
LNSVQFAYHLAAFGRASAGLYAGGIAPTSCLVASSNVLYGTDTYGALFRMNTDGTGYTNVHVFGATQNGTNSDGSGPQGSMVLSGSTLYGITIGGTPTGCGAIFAMSTDGTGFTNLHVFSGPDGAAPYAGLTLSGSMLYGITLYGGISLNGGYGTVFAIDRNGTGFTNLVIFTNDSSQGYFPINLLAISNNTLFGMLRVGPTGSPDPFLPGYHAPSFAINTDGTGYTTPVTNYPQTTQNALGNTLFGTDTYGGDGEGSIFAANSDGTISTLFSFDEDSGTSPNGVLLSGYALYGTTSEGGGVFSLSFLPQLSITISGSIAVLTWPTNLYGFDYSGFTLQSSTSPAATSLWSNVSPGAVVVNGQFTVTNPISGTQQFYRLIQ